MSITVGAAQGDPVRAVLYFSISNFVLFLVATTFLLSLAGINRLETLQILTFNFVLAIFVIGVPIMFLQAFEVSKIAVLCSGAVCLLSYYTFVVVRDDSLRERLSRLL